MDELQDRTDTLREIKEKHGINDKLYQLICCTSKNAFFFYDFVEGSLETLGNWETYFQTTLLHNGDLMNLLDYVDTRDMTDAEEVLFLERTGIMQKTREFRLKKGNLWLEADTSVMYNESLEPLTKVIRLSNVTKFKKQNEELKYMAFYDALTGLYNRNYFIRILTDWIGKSAGRDIISIMFVDIDDFRKINDGMGMIVGDELVQIFGQYLQEFSSEKVMVSHFTSDIFCMAIYDPDGENSVEFIYKAIKERVRNSFLLSDRNELTVSVSCGVAEYPEASQNAVELINNAEIVMFRAKSNGKGNIQYFNHEILETFMQNAIIEHKLKEAVAKRSFHLCFQPQFDTQTCDLRGVEALIRWHDTEGEAISPSVFIPIAEKNNMIIPIGDWVIDESLRIFAGWKQKYHCSIIMSINISPIQYKKRRFVPKLINTLALYDIPYDEIELEITESVLIEEFKDVIEKIIALRDYGIRVSLDDFGTGFSSLSYLKGLPINTLKIDKSFVDTVTEDESSKIIVESIVSMVNKLGYETIAEGVETEEQYNYLKSINCDNIQGFYLGKPMDSLQIEELLQRQLSGNYKVVEQPALS